jgi:hypothetical protein
MKNACNAISPRKKAPRVQQFIHIKGPAMGRMKMVNLSLSRDDIKRIMNNNKALSFEMMIMDGLEGEKARKIADFCHSPSEIACKFNLMEQMTAKRGREEKLFPRIYPIIEFREENSSINHTVGIPV